MKRWIHASTDTPLLSPEDVINVVNQYAAQYQLHYVSRFDIEPNTHDIFLMLNSIKQDNIIISQGPAGKIVSKFNPKWYIRLDPHLLIFCNYDSENGEFYYSKKNSTWQQAIDNQAQQLEQFSEDCYNWETTGTKPESQTSMAKRAAEYALSYYTDDMNLLSVQVIDEINDAAEDFDILPQVTADDIVQGLNEAIYECYFEYYKSSPEAYGGPPNTYNAMIKDIDKWHNTYADIDMIKLCDDGSILVDITTQFIDNIVECYYCIYDGNNISVKKCRPDTFKSLHNLVAFISTE